MRLDDAMTAPRVTSWQPDLVTVLRINEFSGAETKSVTVEPGRTVLSYVQELTPGLTDEDRKLLRVTLHERGREAQLLDVLGWHLTKLKPGAFISIRLPVPENGGILRSILQIVVAIAAYTIGTAIGGPLGALAAAAFAFGANYLINALIPIKDGIKDNKPSPTYSLEGFKNANDPDGPVPFVVGGRHRYPPKYIVPPIPRIVDGKMYVSCAFVCGFAPMKRYKEKIGDRLLDRFKKIEIEYRGFMDDEVAFDTSPFSIVRETFIPQGLDIELRNKEDGAKEGDDEYDAEPTSLFTAADTTRWKVIWQFPEGLFRTTEKKGKKRSREVRIRIRERPVTPTNDAAWTVLESGFKIEKSKSRPFFMEYERSEDFAERGAYEIEFLRTSNDDEDDRHHSVLKIVSFQSVLPEYPINQPAEAPFAMVAVDMMATNQLQGNLDEYNLEGCQLIDALDPETDEYVPFQETANPADWYRHILTMPIRAEPLTLADLNDGEIRDWHAHNVEHDLTFRRVYDYEVDLEDALDDVCQVGRAVKRPSEGLWGVSIDRRKDTLKAEPLVPHNTWGFELSRTYRKLADAWRIKFKDELNDFRDAERIVPRPGFVGTPQLLEELEPPGITHPDQIYVYGVWRWLNITERPDMFGCSQDWESMTLQHGDLTLVTNPMLNQRTASGRVAAIMGPVIVLDEPVEMDAGEDYLIFFRKVVEFEGKGLTQILIRSVRTMPGATSSVTLVGEGDLPEPGDIFGFGPALGLVEECVVQSVENDEKGDARINVINYAPQMFDMLDELVIPPYSSRVGDVLPDDTRPPPIPAIFSMDSSTEVYDDDETPSSSPRRVVIAVEAGSGLPAAATLQLRHKKSTEGDWRTPIIQQSVSQPTFTLNTGYAVGDTIVVQPKALSRLGIPSEWGEERSLLVGSDDTAGPDLTSFTATANADGTVSFAWASSEPWTEARIRHTAGTTGTYDTMTPAHAGFLTSSPVTLPTVYAAGARRFAIQLVNEDGDPGDPAYYNEPIAAEAAPGLPEDFQFTLDAGKAKYSARPATDDTATYDLAFYRGTPAQAVGDATFIDKRISPANTPVGFTETVALPPGVHRGWVRGRGRGGTLGPARQSLADLTISGQTFSDTFPYANGALETVGAANWTQMNGTAAAATVASGKISGTAAGRYSGPDTFSPNLYVESEILYAAASTNAPVAIVIDNNNYVFCRYNAGAWQVYKNVSGGGNLLMFSVTASAPTAGTIIRLEKSAGVVTLKVNGSTIGSPTSLAGDLAAASKPAFFISQAMAAFIDNYKAGIL